MRLPPLSVLASRPEPNYVNPETRGVGNTVVISVLLGFVTAVLGIRVYSRCKISKGFGLDDILILSAYVPAAAFAIAGMAAQSRFQWDRHSWDIEPALITPGLQMTLATEILFDIATSLTKLSMLALIYRLTVASQSRVRYAVMGLAVVIAVDSMVFVVVTIFQCRPVSAYWTLSFAPQDCINEHAHLLAAGCINTATDFIIVLLPIKTVISLKLPAKQRIIVYLLFTGGLLASAAGAVRTFFTWQMTSGFDQSWDSYPVILSSSLELYIGIIVASIPATKPFFSRYLPRLLGNSIWTEVTEPLEERKRRRDRSMNSSPTTASSFFDVGRVASPLPRGNNTMAVSSTPNVLSLSAFAGTPSSAFISPVGVGGPPLQRGDNNARQQLAVSTIPNILSPYTTTLASPSSAFLSPGGGGSSRPNLNKPLPEILLGMEQQAAPRTDSSHEPQLVSNSSSVYDFKAYADGHISVHKATSVPLRQSSR